MIFPLKNWCGILPMKGHPGAFASIRKYDIHTGVDLYTNENEIVYAVEDGVVVNVENFTGPPAGSPWWLPTQSILVEGKSGVICYGEVNAKIEENDKIIKGQEIATVLPVLPEDKKRNDIPGHSRFMLHFELYKHGTTESVWWRLNEKKPSNLLNPTKILLKALNGNQRIL